jgi:hypothetical protein
MLFVSLPLSSNNINLCVQGYWEAVWRHVTRGLWYRSQHAPTIAHLQVYKAKTKVCTRTLGVFTSEWGKAD